MKVITLIADNRALYLLNDEDTLEIMPNYIVVEDRRIYGLSSENTTIHYGVEDPLLVFANSVSEDSTVFANSVSEDSTVIDYSFSHSKFLYDGETWTLNTDWMADSLYAYKETV